MENPKVKRILSPSSINTYKQCPRKWYYRYIKKMKTLPSIYLIRGTIVHSVLEDFYKIDVSYLPEDNYENELKGILLALFHKYLTLKRVDLNNLNLTNEEMEFYYKETIGQLINWFERFSKKLKKNVESYGLVPGFESLKPKTEVELISQERGVKGFVDAVHEEGNIIKLIDYKTSSKDCITDDYKLQLAIYAMLYEEKHGIRPTFVGIDFLKHDEKNIFVDDSLIEFAKEEIKFIHKKVESEDMKDYPKSKSPLCKWATGQCDFYDVCSQE